MKTVFILLPICLIACLLITLSGCTESTNARLDTMNGHMDRVASQIEADQKYIKSSSDQVQALTDNSSRIAKETEIYEDSIKTLAEQMKKMADSLGEFQKMGASVTEMLKEALKPVPPSPTADIDDVLKK